MTPNIWMVVYNLRIVWEHSVSQMLPFRKRFNIYFMDIKFYNVWNIYANIIWKSYVLVQGIKFYVLYRVQKCCICIYELSVLTKY